MRKKTPSQEMLLSAFAYEQRIGVLNWRRRINVRPEWNTRFAGRAAGYRTKLGYVAINLDGQMYLAHVLIWKIVTGCEPVGDIDHKDGDGSNNKFDNLREATRTQNMMNQKRWGKMPKGVRLHRPTGRYAARIKLSGRDHSLGYFDTPEKAHAAYCAAAKEHFGDFARFE